MNERPSLAGLLAPRSIAMIGASDRNVFSALAASCLKAVDYKGKVFAVNRDGKTAHGFPGFSSVAAIGEPVDAAYVGIPSASVIPTIAEAAEAGIRNFIVVSGGFAETGEDGVKAQAELADLARRKGLNILGPNCLGFFNLQARSALGALTVTDLPRPGSVALISASGALASQMLRFAARYDIGISHAIATGNEACVNSADILEYLVDDPDVRAIGIFLEGIRDEAKFIAAAKAARRARKPIVILKVGASPLAKTVAMAHTATDTGDDAAFDALCDRLGIVRVETLDELVVTPALIAQTGPLRAAGACFVSMSGGACEIVADMAARHGLDLPDFSASARAALDELIAGNGLGQVHNPLDLTGAVARDPGLWEKIIKVIDADARFGIIVAHTEQPDEWERTGAIEAIFAHLSIAMKRHGPHVVLMPTYAAPVGAFDREVLRAAGAELLLPGQATGVSAVARALRWSEHIRAFERG